MATISRSALHMPSPSAQQDQLWYGLRAEAVAAAAAEPLLAPLLQSAILKHDRFEAAIASLIATKMETPLVDAAALNPCFLDALDDEAVIQAIRADLSAYVARDAACSSLLSAVLYFKGSLALMSYRIAHRLWRRSRRDLAYYLQSRASECFDVDIHPAMQMGQGVMIDHATGVVIGETAVVEDDVSILHSVTLGGTGKECGDRHPKVRTGVLIGAGAKILGNIEIGAHAKIAAGSVVLSPVPAYATAAGIPARIVAMSSMPSPAHTMDHSLPDDLINPPFEILAEGKKPAAEV